MANRDESSKAKRRPKIIIRQMELDDLAPVFHLGEQLFTSDELPILYRTWDPYEVTDAFSDDPDYCFVAETDGQVKFNKIESITAQNLHVSDGITPVTGLFTWLDPITFQISYVASTTTLSATIGGVTKSSVAVNMVDANSMLLTLGVKGTKKNYPGGVTKYSSARITLDDLLFNEDCGLGEDMVITVLDNLNTSPTKTVYWNITNFDFSEDFTLTGKIDLEWSSDWSLGRIDCYADSEITFTFGYIAP